MPLPFESKSVRGVQQTDTREPSELLSVFLSAERPHEVLPWIRCGSDGKPAGEFRMQVLKQREVDQCKVDAERYVRHMVGESSKEFSSEAWRDMYQDALCSELLYHACRHVDDAEKRLFGSPDDIRELTADEVVSLYNSYEQIQFRFGPLFRLLTDEQIEWWIEALSRGAESIPFGQLSHGQLVQLIVSLGVRLQSSTTGRSSLGSASSDGLTETNQSSGRPSDPEKTVGDE